MCQSHPSFVYREGVMVTDYSPWFLEPSFVLYLAIDQPLLGTVFFASAFVLGV
ncbi:hypothetical protein GTF94_13830 [Roseobacter sp. HKCCD5914]|jgi:hypothetical protein|uniref:hypothetical protein n=1 Tax=unclassified Roseobacter TaxID=196798 RepID=UPI00119BA39F|nr:MULTISPECIES: hypothetical protein [unclassified Roseobacter]NNV30502.1 hypothetical protein [Roseobacter sp. HKCCD9061]NNV94365.1 hypothetical protein [Roseobacter sp. HKCCD8914]NNW20374.1 hypothetical protein [Roseobacter sp. HKCCD7543]NNW41679.1 hypothetical protein [Roseobacter sp. HKCCD8654]NNW45951.1 hypothetical protein [Roseobacter sp. HKCCD8291]NNW88704.1 hypothetical protein [Roseobacter sp. HKCCD8272]NNX22517.1 hypothetical protein [Roseobacter sp. HKCCD8626]NNX31150.1 hypothe